MSVKQVGQLGFADAVLVGAAQGPLKRASGSRGAAPWRGGTKRSGKAGSSYGYKAHMGVDEGSGLIRAVLTTPANINDTLVADDLIRGDERVVWGDGAYHTHARQARLDAAGVRPRLIRRANKHHPLPERIKHYNRLIARRRAAVETTFATLKNRMKLTQIRYRGLIKASAQVTLAAIPSTSDAGPPSRPDSVSRAAKA